MRILKEIRQNKGNAQQTIKTVISLTAELNLTTDYWYFLP
jgi:hypothetical protein